MSMPTFFHNKYSHLGFHQNSEQSMTPVAVQALDSYTALRTAEYQDGIVTQELRIINAVTAKIPACRMDILQTTPGGRTYGWIQK